MSENDGTEPQDDIDEEMVLYVYDTMADILETQRDISQDLNTEAANLIRLLGIVLGLYAGALTLAVEVAVPSENSVTYSDFVTEYFAVSVLLLAVGFLYAILAYHETDIKTAPEPVWLTAMLDENTVQETRYQYTQKATEWISDNRIELKTDHTRPFNCKMSVFFGLSYFVGGTIVLVFDPSLSVRIVAFAVVLWATYQVYGTVRALASG